jgi:hypothetical protein
VGIKVSIKSGKPYSKKSPVFTGLFSLFALFTYWELCINRDDSQRGNQHPSIEEEQTTQWPKEKGQKNKQRSTKHAYKTKNRVTRTPLKRGGELRCSGRVGSSCSTKGKWLQALWKIENNGLKDPVNFATIQ